MSEEYKQTAAAHALTILMAVINADCTCTPTHQFKLEQILAMHGDLYRGILKALRGEEPTWQELKDSGKV